MQENNNECNLFVDFIWESGLMDITCKGKRYYWYSEDGRSMSWNDRIIMLDIIMNRWNVVGQLIGERDISDHFPICLVLDEENWGPKPFKFNNKWFSNKNFIPFVEKEWREIIVEGRGDFILKEKLWILKERLRWWNKVVFGRVNLEVEEKVRDINLADEHLEQDIEFFNFNIVLNRKEATREFWMKLRIKENMLAQKSKVKWLNESDCNSSFFHKVLKEKRRINHIGSISSSGIILERVEEVKEEVLRHFSNKYGAERERWGLEGIEFDRIS
ncbi:uncharacterized protein LOC131597559 [Vicia villosa]|uniref:uncharacterized protein LOC131597559 n=1 Tax=Vicia villosa TaxID=3911 RepID=UPI00273A992C|nr:uncharacterized protein LOC131597559 [Vicia villosa]